MEIEPPEGGTTYLVLRIENGEWKIEIEPPEGGTSYRIHLGEGFDTIGQNPAKRKRGNYEFSGWLLPTH